MRLGPLPRITIPSAPSGSDSFSSSYELYREGVRDGNSPAQVSTVLYAGCTPQRQRASRIACSVVPRSAASWRSENPMRFMRRRSAAPTPERIFQIKRALVAGVSVDDIAAASGIDPWFLFQLAELLVAEREVVALTQRGAADLRRMKRMGFSDRQLAALRGTTEQAMREARWRWGVHPAYKTVDTCAGEFPSRTPYLYSSYDDENESEPLGAEGIVILGSGPNRIGQGVEFDYCCVRAGLAFRELGFKTIMINSNPETVSTDFDI